MKRCLLLSSMIVMLCGTKYGYSQDQLIRFTAKETAIRKGISENIFRGQSRSEAKGKLEANGFTCYIGKDDPCSVTQEWTSCKPQITDRVILTCFRLPHSDIETPLRWQVSAAMSNVEPSLEMPVAEIYIQADPIEEENK